MNNPNIPKASDLSMLKNLIFIAKTHRKKLIKTFSLVALENILFLLYPLIGSFIINAIMNGEVVYAILYACMIMLIWGVGSARRAIDTRAFVKIYADIAVPLIIQQRESSTTSTTTARVALSRQFISFFEEHLPIFIMAFFSIIGSVVMLLFIETLSGILASIILLIFIVFLPKYTKTNDKLYFKLNNRLEKEVELIEKVNKHSLIRHYNIISRLRIAISNREAISYLIIGLTMAILFGFTLVNFSLNGYGSAGHIYAVMTYLWGFAMSLDDMPRLMEQFSELNDISKRVDVADEQDLHKT